MEKLIGSEKQIAWAEKIRKSTLKTLKPLGQAHLEAAEKITSCTWWIDSRDLYIADLCGKLGLPVQAKADQDAYCVAIGCDSFGVFTCLDCWENSNKR